MRWLLLLIVPQQTAVDEECCSRDVVGFIGSQEIGQTGDVFRLAEPAERNVLQQFFELYRIIQEFCVDGCFDGAGRDRVDSDLVRGEFDGQVSRQHLDSSLARAIGGKMRERELFVDRTDIDDFPRAIGLPKVTHDRLGHKKHTLQVDIENGVEIRFGHIPEVRAFLHAGVIDEDIYFAEARDGLFNESLPVGNDSDVGLKGGRALLHLGYSRYYFVRAFFVLAITDRDVRAFSRQTLCNRTSDSLIAAGYGGYFALQPIGQDFLLCFPRVTTRILCRLAPSTKCEVPSGEVVPSWGA